MFMHTVLLREPCSEVASRIESAYANRHYKVNDVCYLVRTEGLTQDVAVAAGIKGDDRVNSAKGVVLKLNGAYSGFESQSLWEWLAIEV